MTRKNMKEGKRGQVTLFIILAIIIAGGVLAYFLWVEPNLSFQSSSKRVGFEGCIQDALEETIMNLSAQGGYVSPKGTYMYNDEDWAYLCYTNEYYTLCNLQVAFFYDFFEEQLNLAMRDDIDSCYESSLKQLKSEGYDVTSGDVSYNVTLSPTGVVSVDLNAPTTVGTQSFQEFNIELDSAIYKTLSIVNTILQYENQYGDSDMETLRYYYPDYKFIKVKRSDGTTVYSVKEGESGNEFKFASRSLVWPAGYDI
jgi:hypothetical protein